MLLICLKKKEFLNNFIAETQVNICETYPGCPTMEQFTGRRGYKFSEFFVFFRVRSKIRRTWHRWSRIYNNNCLLQESYILRKANEQSFFKRIIVSYVYTPLSHKMRRFLGRKQSRARLIYFQFYIYIMKYNREYMYCGKEIVLTKN